jgi:transposase
MSEGTGMNTISDDESEVTLGIDTHLEQHVAAALDPLGRLLGTISVPPTAAGHERLLSWASAFGLVMRAGVEGTGCYGAGVTRFLQAAGVEVIEVTRAPRRQERSGRRPGRRPRGAGRDSDRDAEAADRHRRVDPGTARCAEDRGEGTNSDRDPDQGDPGQRPR